MKAICVSDDWLIAKELGHYMPTCGEIVEIIDVFDYPPYGEYYELEKGPPQFGYDANKFILGEENKEKEDLISDIYKTPEGRRPLIVTIGNQAFFNLK